LISARRLYAALHKTAFRVSVAFSVEASRRPGGRNSKIFTFVWALHLMVELARDTRSFSTARIGAQPIALAAATLLVVLAGVASIAFWRAYSGAAPEPDRAAAARQFQVRAAQAASEQLVEKAKGLEATQQEAIDQLQMVQDQLQTVRRQLAAQQADTRRLSERVSTLTEEIDGLRQSHASTQASEPAARNRSVRTRAHASHSANHRRGKSRS
jgi:septal ring factor EnvC (AmiA/AmiB activator)